jgi:hypothetical protein
MGMVWNSSTASNDEDSMSADWADEEAARLSNLDRDTREESQWVCDQIASALRSAFQRGKVEAFREASLHMYTSADDPAYPMGSKGFDYAMRTAAEFDCRADALEQENKD